MAIGTFVDRLLRCPRTSPAGHPGLPRHIRQAKTYGAARLELACVRALAAGALSSRYIEQLLRADQRQSFLGATADDGLGEHVNVRGAKYYVN